MVMLRQAGDVRIDVPVKLKASCDAGLDQGLQGAEDGGAPDAGHLSAKAAIELVGGLLPPRSGEHGGNLQALPCHALTGGDQTIPRGK